MSLSQGLAPIVRNQGLLPCLTAEVYEGCTATSYLLIRVSVYTFRALEEQPLLSLHLLIVYQLDSLGFLNDRLM